MTRRGFSLMELVFAIGLMGLALAPLSALLSSGASTARTSLDEVIAGSYLTDLVEQIEAAPADALPGTLDLSTEDGWLADGATLGRITLRLPPAPRGVAVTLRIETPRPYLRHIRASARRTGLSVDVETLVEQEVP